MSAIMGLTRLKPASTVEDRKDFASCFNATLDQLGIRPGEEFLIARADALAERAPRAGRCVFCDGTIDPERDYRKESGWACKRSAGGTNALALREAHEEGWACRSCVGKAKRGIAPTQESLSA